MGSMKTMFVFLAFGGFLGGLVLFIGCVVSGLTVVCDTEFVEA